MSLPAISNLSPTANKSTAAKTPAPAPVKVDPLDAIRPPVAGVPSPTPAPAPAPLAIDAPMQNLRFLALFAVNGKGRHVVNVPHTSDPELQKAAAWKVIKTKFPGLPPADIRRIAAKVEMPAPPPVIPVSPGMTIRQLFVDGSETEATLEIGKTRFNGTPQRIILRHLRSKSVFSFDLREEVSDEITRFSVQQPVTHLVEALPKILANVLKGAEGFSWLFRLRQQSN